MRIKNQCWRLFLTVVCFYQNLTLVKTSDVSAEDEKIDVRQSGMIYPTTLYFSELENEVLF